jgi:hypothetical protein
MCYVWLANLTFALSRDLIEWARGLLATRLAIHRRDHDSAKATCGSLVNVLAGAESAAARRQHDARGS